MDFNSLTTSIDSEWFYPTNTANGLDEALEEPVPFEDFKFSFGMDPDYSIPLNSDIFPSAPDPFLQEPPSFPPTTVLDENDQKTFSSFLDTFFMDLDGEQLNNFYPLDSSDGQDQKEDENRRCSILQSLDEQKKLARMNVMASLPNKLTSLSPAHPVTHSPSNDDKNMTPSHSKDTPLQSIFLLKGDEVTPPYVRTNKRSPDPIKEIKPVKKPRGSKELLTEEEKRANHIASEQKRRSTIRNGFKDLTDLVPTLKNVNNSKSIVLFKSVDFIRHLEKRNKDLREKLHSLQLRAQVEGRMTDHSSHPNTENTEQKTLTSSTEKPIKPNSPISAPFVHLKPTVEKIEISNSTSNAYGRSSISSSSSSNSSSGGSGISISNRSFSSRNNSLSSSTSTSSSITSSTNLEGVAASARKALLVHKAQQEQLLKLQEQLQLHQRLIAERQEMKEKALQSAKRKTTQCDLTNYNNILNDLEDKAISAP